MNERPTPETDAEIEGIRNSIKKEHQFDWAIEVARKLERERDELLQWKKETLLVESQWDEQAVGRLLGLRLGDFIKPNIEPKLRQLIKERDEAREVASGLAKQAERLRKERNESRNKMADALQEVDLRTLDFERMKQERDGLLLELEEYRSIAENIGAVKAVSEKEKAIRERDEAMAERDRYKRQWEESRMETVEGAK